MATFAAKKKSMASQDFLNKKKVEHPFLKKPMTHLELEILIAEARQQIADGQVFTTSELKKIEDTKPLRILKK